MWIFHQLSPLGQVGLVVAMCVSFYLCRFVSLMSPFHVTFFKASHWSSGIFFMLKSPWEGGGAYPQIYLTVIKKKKNHATSSNLYWFYYPHRSRELVSPVCRIFFWTKMVKLIGGGSLINEAYPV